MTARIAQTFAAGGVVVVGMGADGWAGLGEGARHALREAATVIASPRQLEALPVWLGARRVEWRSPRREDIAGLVQEHAARGVVVLASGDPLFYGIGRTLVEELGAERLHFLPYLSSASLACARLRWPVEEVRVVNAAGGGLDALPEHLAPERRLLVLSAGRDTPAALAARLVAHGYGESELVVLGDLGAPEESRWAGRAQGWSAEITCGLNVVAVIARRGAPPPRAARAPAPAPLAGVRGGPPAALVAGALMASLDPAPGEALWEIGGTGVCAAAWAARPGAGDSTSLWPTGEKALIDSIAERAEAAAPDAVLLAGPLASPGAVDACRRALRPGGRLVVAGLSVDEAAVLARHHRGLGGHLTRLALADAGVAEGATTWSAGPELLLWRLDTPQA